jgi:hypothetical protein
LLFIGIETTETSTNLSKDIFLIISSYFIFSNSFIHSKSHHSFQIIFQSYSIVNFLGTYQIEKLFSNQAFIFSIVSSISKRICAFTNNHFSSILYSTTFHKILSSLCCNNKRGFFIYSSIHSKASGKTISLQLSKSLVEAYHSISKNAFSHLTSLVFSIQI